MIISVWKPKTKVIDKKPTIVLYEICTIEDIYKPGSSNFRVVYKCDCENCKTPDKIYSINRQHLSHKRSKTVNEDVQICRPCQTRGENNPRWGDNRTWDELHGLEKSNMLKSQRSLSFSGENNPSCNVEYVLRKKKNNIEKYGVENVFAAEYVKEKIKKTNLEKYGVDHILKSDVFKEKIKKTNLEKYGTEYPIQSKGIMDKVKLTCMDRYGVSHIMYSDEIKERLRNNNLEKWGVDNPMKNEEFRLKFNITNNPNYIKYLSDGVSLFICDISGDHNFEISCSNFIHRNNHKIPLCTICNPIGNSRSIKENELYDYITGIYNGEIIQSYRDGLEIDIYLPELKLGFEFNGIYWHSEEKRGKNYHYDKTNYFNDKGIRVIHIWEDDWMYKNDVVKSQIINWLGLTSNKIYARKCDVRVMNDPKIVRKFLNDNHIQGYVISVLKLGLYHNDYLVGMMIFDHSEGRKKMGDDEWNLARFCNKLGTNVIGGASKLMKYFVEHYKPSRIISYADRDWSFGDLYYKLGLDLVSKSKPDYKYIVDGLRVHKSRYKKNNLNTKLTEKQEMVKRNIDRVYDCGKLKFEIMY